ncbi:hypothetical protein U1Q18_047536 [Sarracenia purpurea var. burkii]
MPNESIPNASTSNVIRASKSPTLLERFQAQEKSYKENNEIAIMAINECYSKENISIEDVTKVIDILDRKQSKDIQFYNTRMEFCDSVFENLLRKLKDVDLKLERLQSLLIERDEARNQRYRKLIKEKYEIRGQLQQWIKEFNKQIEKTDQYIEELLQCIESNKIIESEKVDSKRLTDRFPSERPSNDPDTIDNVYEEHTAENRSVHKHNTKVHENVVAAMTKFSSITKTPSAEIIEGNSKGRSVMQTRSGLSVRVSFDDTANRTNDCETNTVPKTSHSKTKPNSKSAAKQARVAEANKQWGRRIGHVVFFKRRNVASKSVRTNLSVPRRTLHFSCVFLW